jgi:flagellum-specific ATP synthase
MRRLDLETLRRAVAETPLFRRGGRLHRATGILTCPLAAAIGDHCELHPGPGQPPVLAEVIGFDGANAHLVPYDNLENPQPGMPIVHLGEGLLVPVGDALLGRVIDGLGRPIDGKPDLAGLPRVPVHRAAPAPLERQRIRRPFVTGIRAIDSAITCGRGQRVGIFAGSGVGKSTLLGEIARGAESDVNVVALIGERGREVGPFLEDCLGKDGLRRSAVVVATGEQSPLMRVRAAQAAVAVAEHFRDEGRNVLFMLDSLTRLAMAQREMGLALGEPPSARGYTPSVFRLLASTVERLGNGAAGALTGLLTVLVDGDDMDEPIADAVRSLVDGHIVLERRLAEKGHYPAINVSRSVSRVALDVTEPAHQAASRKLRAVLATYAEAEDLIRIGAYVKGSSPAVDRAIELMPAVERFLRQEVGRRSAFEETRAGLAQLAAGWPF